MERKPSSTAPEIKKLSLKLSREAAAAIVRGIDGGPGVELDFRGL
jgi:hypothetical protein